VPTEVVATWAGNFLEGTFTLVARGGPVPGYTIIAPDPPPSQNQPSAAPMSDGRMASGQRDSITVYNIDINSPVIYFTVEPVGTQPAFLITVSPSIIR
jgi:hypothetical protein